MAKETWEQSTENREKRTYSRMEGKKAEDMGLSVEDRRRKYEGQRM